MTQHNIVEDTLDTIGSMNLAIIQAGGVPIPNDEILKMSLPDFLNICARNDIRFKYNEVVAVPGVSRSLVSPGFATNAVIEEMKVP